MRFLDPIDSTRVLVIPARRNSTRLPDKLLLRETGMTVLQHTWEAACQAQRPEAIIIAADDEHLANEARGFGASVVMTRADHVSGTDRVAEVVRQLPRAETIVNLQGDEPEINPADIDTLFDCLASNLNAGMATLATPIRELAALEDPACVKVVFDNRGKAMYFSRSPIPHVRQWDNSILAVQPPAFYQHVGIYAYRRWPLLRLAELPQGRAEQLEKLEQLRVLENGDEILVAVIDQAAQGIDTPTDYGAFVRRYAGHEREQRAA